MTGAYRDMEKCWKLPMEVRHHWLSQRYGNAWLPKYCRRVTGAEQQEGE